MKLGSHCNVGIGTTTPGSTLDVKGTMRLSGATSGYVGLAPATNAGSTTYTLPSSDGATGDVLSTNGSGTLSWTANGGAPPSGTHRGSRNVLCNVGSVSYDQGGSSDSVACKGNTITATCTAGTGEIATIVNCPTGYTGKKLVTYVNSANSKYYAVFCAAD